MIISMAATEGDGGAGEQTVVMINDVARAFFEAKATRAIRIEIPLEDKTE